jgi:hypothetical protein
MRACDGHAGTHAGPGKCSGAVGRAFGGCSHAVTTKCRYANGLPASEDGPRVDDTVSCAYNNGQRQSRARLQPDASAWVESYEYEGGMPLVSVRLRRSGGEAIRVLEAWERQ